MAPAKFQPDWKGSCGRWGSIVTACGGGDPASDDKAEVGLYTDLVQVGKDRGNPKKCTKVKTTPTDCLKIRSCIQKQMRSIENKCYVYKPIGHNSNTTWRTAFRNWVEGNSIPKPPGTRPGRHNFDKGKSCKDPLGCP